MVLVRWNVKCSVRRDEPGIQSHLRDSWDIMLSEGSQTPRRSCETLERTNPIWSKGVVFWRPGWGSAKRGHKGLFLGDVSV